MFQQLIISINIPTSLFLMQGTLLTPSQLKELNCMVHNILEDNKKTLDQLLNQILDLQSANILSLYKHTVQEWNKQQKTIENLCYFSISMMSSVQLLWEQQQQQKQKQIQLKSDVASLQLQINTLIQQNENCRAKIIQAETHLEQISAQKEYAQNFYASQTCIQFNSQRQWQNQTNQLQSYYQMCSALQHQSSISDRQKQQIIRQSSFLLEKKDSQLEQLKNQKQTLQRKFQSLMQEHQIAKMQIHLAELAVKRNSQQQQQNLSENINKQEIYVSGVDKSFLNEQLCCFQQIDAYQSYTLLQDLTQGEGDNRISTTSLARKKNSIYDSSQFLTNYHEKKTISIQCDLIKNLPKIQFSTAKIETQASDKSKSTLESIKNIKIKVLTQQIDSMKNKKSFNKPLKNSCPQQGNFSKLFDYLSSKLVTKRIKK